MKLVRKELVITDYEGNQHKLRKLSLVENKEMVKEMKECDPHKDADKIIEIQENVLRKCGASDELLGSLEAEDFAAICREVIGAKKLNE